MILASSSSNIRIGWTLCLPLQKHAHSHANMKFSLTVLCSRQRVLPDDITNLGNLYNLYINDNQVTYLLAYFTFGQAACVFTLSCSSEGGFRQTSETWRSCAAQGESFPPPPLFAIHFALTRDNGSLFNNTFEGPIPDSIGQLSSAIALYLDENELTGQIPTSIGKMTSLIDLR